MEKTLNLDVEMSIFSITKQLPMWPKQEQQALQKNEWSMENLSELGMDTCCRWRNPVGASLKPVMREAKNSDWC